METVKSFLYNLGFNPSADGTLYLRKAIIARIANPKAQLTDLCAQYARGGYGRDRRADAARNAGSHSRSLRE